MGRPVEIHKSQTFEGMTGLSLADKLTVPAR